MHTNTFVWIYIIYTCSYPRAYQYIKYIRYTLDEALNIDLLTQHIKQTKKMGFPKDIGPSVFYMYLVKCVFSSWFPSRWLAEQYVVSLILWEKESKEPSGRHRERKEFTCKRGGR